MRRDEDPGPGRDGERGETYRQNGFRGDLRPKPRRSVLGRLHVRKLGSPASGRKSRTNGCPLAYSVFAGISRGSEALVRRAAYERLMRLRGTQPEAADVPRRRSSRNVVGHPLIFGELLMGDRGQTPQLLRDYDRMAQVGVVSHADVVSFVQGRKLHGRGVGGLMFTSWPLQGSSGCVCGPRTPVSTTWPRAWE